MTNTLQRALNRHELRIRTMKYIYTHLVISKPIFQLIFEEGKIMSPNGSTYILEVLKHCEKHEDEYIEEINNRLHNWSFERLAYVEQAILLLALTEFNLRHDDRAVIMDEAIKLTKLYSDDSSYSYINAVLDAYEPKRI